jgi:DsbC/DsbD-like thiol-disulfide interchange protein
MPLSRDFMRLKAATCALLLVLATPLGAQQGDGASAWSEATHSAVRLIAGGRNADGAYRIGIEIRMKDGFKTYWRMPGDAGVPPVFDWTSSENVGSISLRWPAPKRYVDAGVTTIGYKERVIFPAVMRAADTGKPVTATLKLDYAVCDRICIPAKAELTLKLPEAAEQPLAAELDAFRAQVPRSKEPGKLDNKPGLVSASYVPDKGIKAVDLVIAVPAGAALHDVFLEGPDGWLFGTPTTLASDGDKVTMRLPIEDRPKNAAGLLPVVLTMSAAPHSSEIRFDLDIPAPKP